MPTASSLAWKSLRKVRTLWHCSRLRAWRFTACDWSWWYPSGRRPLQQYRPAGRWLWSSFRRRVAMIAKLKRAERSERLMYERSLQFISALVICIIVCLSWAVNHCNDNAITYKASATKMPETEAGERGQLLTCRCVSVMLLRSMQNTRRS